MKRLICILCLILAVFMLPVSACGESGEIRESGLWWWYRVREDGTAELTEYNGIAVHEVIPAEIDGRMVTALSGSVISEWAQTVEIPATVTAIVGNPFKNNTRLKEFLFPGGSDAFRVENGMLISTADARLICMLAGAAKGKITVPEGIRVIGKDAFFNQKSLTGVTLPASIVSIEDNPFRNCDKLKDILVADGNTAVSLENGMLLNRGEGKLILAISGKVTGEISIPDGITTICPYAFYRCKGMTGIDCPDTVKEIGEGAFMYSSVHKAELPAGLKVIESNTFSGCENLAAINIPETVESIGNGAFSYCFGLTEITLSSTLKELGSSSFDNCLKLEGITLPDGLETIGTYTFSNSGLKQLTLPDSVVSIGTGLCLSCRQLQSVTLSSSLKEIPDYAFCECEMLRTVRHFPEGVESIGEFAFATALIENPIVLGPSLKRIGEFAFSAAYLTLPKGEFELEDDALGGSVCHVVPGSWADYYCKAFGIQTD